MTKTEKAMAELDRMMAEADAKRLAVAKPWRDAATALRENRDPITWPDLARRFRRAIEAGRVSGAAADDFRYTAEALENARRMTTEQRNAWYTAAVEGFEFEATERYAWA